MNKLKIKNYKLKTISIFSSLYHLKRTFLFISLFYFIILNQNLLLADEREVITLEYSVPVTQELTIEGRKSFPEISQGDYDRGYIELKDAITLQISSNIPWQVVIFSNQINLYKSRGKFKSVDNFQCRIGSEPYQSISKNPVVIMEGKGGIKDQTIKLDYRMKLDWNDTPPGKWEFKPEFRIEPEHSEQSKINYQQYSESRLFSTSNGVTFPIITAEALDKGYIDSKICFRLSDLCNQIRSANKSVSDVLITCDQPYFTPYKSKKSHRDLLWKLHNEPESRFRPIDFQMAIIHSGGSFQNVELDFRLILNWKDTPGNYSFESIIMLETKKINQSLKERKANHFME